MLYLLHHLLSESAAKYPEKKAVVFKDQCVTYAELEKRTNLLALTLSGLNIRKGDRIAIYMNRSIAAIIALFGILKKGGVYVPIDPLCPPSRLAYILNKSGIKLLLTTGGKLATLEKVIPEIPLLSNILVMDGLEGSFRTLEGINLIEWQADEEGENFDISREDGVDTDLAYILFTSGSTGNPKGVMISHLNSLTFVNSAHQFFQIKEEDNLSNICPLHFDMSVFDIFVAFKAGASVYIVPENISIFPSQLALFIEKNKITVWNSVPSALTLLASLANLEKYDFSSLRRVLFAGEVFPVKYLRRLQSCMPMAQFYNIYGQTEANSSTYYQVGRLLADETAIIPIGKPLPNFEVFALDEDGKEISKMGEKGELYVRASSVARGYWGETEKTAECFVRNPLRPDSNEVVYKTGDIVCLDKDANFIFLTRKDHLIKSRGYRIEIGEIEKVLLNHPEVKNAVVVPIPDELIGNRISAVIVASPGRELKKEDILKHCSRILPKYMIPEIVEFCKELPTVSSGKVDRRKIAESMGQRFCQAHKED